VNVLSSARHQSVWYVGGNKVNPFKLCSVWYFSRLDPSGQGAPVENWITCCFSGFKSVSPKDPFGTHGLDSLGVP
jgi:hypothetical protein